LDIGIVLWKAESPQGNFIKIARDLGEAKPFGSSKL
jgi:hypothetical protein